MIGAFTNLETIYETIAESLDATVCRNRGVRSVVRRDGKVLVEDMEGVKEEFDKIVFACNSSAALACLGDDASWMEKRCLGSVQVRQLCVQHNFAVETACSTLMM